MPHFDLDNAFRERLLATQVANNTNNYEVFLNVVHDEISAVTKLMTKQANLIHDDKEDKLTLFIISYFTGARLNCTRETNSNGHVDITIRSGKFNWLAECKIHKGNQWTYHGFEQLTENYSTGLEYENHGGIIVYNKTAGKHSKQCANEFRQYLESSDLEIEFKDFKNGYFDCTLKEHPRSGEPYHIRSFFVNLKYTPSKDIKGKKL